MNRKQKALDSSSQQFNCAQSVLFAFAEDLGLDRDTALKIAACFGGGMRCGETCGAVTGALMAIGLKYGSAKENDAEGKQAAYAKSLPFIREFNERHGSCLCRELLGYNPGNPEDAQKIKELNLHDKVCVGAITDAVEMTEKILGLD